MLLRQRHTAVKPRALAHIDRFGFHVFISKIAMRWSSPKKGLGDAAKEALINQVFDFSFVNKAVRSYSVSEVH
jgi:hypothetical protein